MAILPVRIAGRLTLGIVVLLGVTALAVYGVMTLFGKPQLVAAGSEAAAQSASALSRQLMLQLQRIEGSAVAISNMAEVAPHDEGLLKRLLPNMVDSEAGDVIASGGLVWAPYKFQADTERKALFWVRNAQGKLEYTNDYNQPSTPPYFNELWYEAARKGQPERCNWSALYRDTVTGVAMTTCLVQVNVEGVFSGIVGIDYRLDGLVKFLREQGGVSGGYAFAVDQDGNVLYFPGQEQTKDLVTVQALGDKLGWLQPVAQALTKTKESTTLYLPFDGTLQGPAYVTLETLPNTGWRVGLVTPEVGVTGLADQLTRNMLLLLLPLLAMLLGLAWLACRRLLAQLAETTQQIERLGEDGTRAVDLEIRRADEIGELRGAVNHYAGSLREMLKRIAVDAAVLEDQANNLAQLSRGLADRAELQREDNTLLATAITEMSASAGEVARNTTDCSDSARQSLGTVRSGQDKMQLNNASMQGLASDISGAAEAITQLGDDIERVGGVLDVIKSISEQTNLLALNAAIEAARAGEQGRGFAVVADEVRTLAGRTQASANEIQEMIARLRQASGTAVSTMQAGVQRTQQTVREAVGVGETLGDTVASFDNIVERAQQIAVAAQEQSHVTQEINELAVRIHAGSEEGARDAGKLRELGHEMQALSSRLNSLSQGR